MNEILKLLKIGESSKIQFKERINDKYDIGCELVAFSNTKGGRLIIGGEGTTKKQKRVRNEERMLSVSDLTVFAKMLLCHQIPMKSQEMTKFR